MKKRFLQTITKRAQSLRLFSLLVCLGFLIPAAGWGQSLTVGNITVDVSQDGYWTTDETGKLTETEDTQNYNVFYNSTNKILTLKDATIVDEVTNYSGSIIRIDNFDQFTILLIGNNTLTSTNNNRRLMYGSYSNVVIEGQTADATLTGNSISDCIQFDNSDNLTIKNCIVNVTSSSWGGILVYGGTLTLQNNEQVTVESKELALVGENGINITDSKVTTTANGAEINTIYSDGNITINHSTVEAIGTSEKAYPVVYAYGDITVENASKVTATSSGMRGIYTDGDMTINGSTVTATGSTNEGMVVVGTLTVTNSTLTASSKPNDFIPAIVTEHLNITASEVTAQGGFDLMDWNEGNTDDISFSITPAEGKLAEFKVDGTNWDGATAIHFREEGQESPYDTKVDFSAASMNWLGSYRYIYIGEHVHTGGTANCENPAICDDCGRPYGDKNPDYHHYVEKMDAKEATCTEPGNIEYWRCAACGKCYSDVALTEEISIAETIIPAGHKIIKVEAKVPTCTEPGNKEYWTCSVCGKYFSDEAGTQVITKEETVDPATGHSLTKTDYKAPTCTEAGNIEYWYCENCGKLFSDASATKELTDVVIPATGHHYVNGYCTECGHRDPDYRPDPISYYNIYVEDVCDGVEVTLSNNVVREGNSISVYVKKDTVNYTFDNFKVYYKRSYYGTWDELKEGTQPGEYPIKNIWTHIYIKAEGAEVKEDPTGIESIEGVKVYTKDGSLYVQTPQREQVIIVSMSGAVVKNEEQIGLKQYHGLQPGIYIVRVGDRAYKVRLN